ncbi:MAG: PKD domain-containing protein, partial [DPANN group archaeon]|nr:PKD domain-containing protein [DPANN group archaeon]
ECTVTDNDGDAASDGGNIDVNEDLYPVAHASADPESGYAPLEVQFTCDGAGGNGELSYAWTFGDGSSSSSQNPVHTYSAVGQYPAECTVTDEDGDTASASVMIDVDQEIVDLVPTVEASGTPTTGYVPSLVQFTCNGSGGDAPLSYRWTFGDGSSSDEQNPTHAYFNAGHYDAVCTATDVDGDSAQDTVALDFEDEPVPDVHDVALYYPSVPSEGTEGETLIFKTQVKNQGTVPESSMVRFFVDGIEQDACSQGFAGLVPDETTPSYSCEWVAVTGDHAIKILVDPVTGETDLEDNDYQQTVFVEALPPVDLFPSVSADATPKSGYAPLDVQFTCNGSGGDAPLSYAWTFGDGSSSSSQNPVHTYSAVGQYHAVCTVTDNDGDAASDGGNIDVSEEPIDLFPTVTAHASPEEGYAPLMVNLICDGQGGDAPLSYAWNFGDGAASDEQNATHTYVAPGTYTATCSATDADGDAASDSVSVRVFEEPVPDTHDLAVIDTVFPADNHQAGSLMNWSTKVENQGDVTESSILRFYVDGAEQASCRQPITDLAPGAISPEYACSWLSGPYSYRQKRVFKVSVDQVSEETDLADNYAEHAVEMIPADRFPSVEAAADPDNGYAPLTVQFTCKGAGGDAPLSYQWTFGDGAESDEQNPAHIYALPGDYAATCTAHDEDGDAASDSVSVRVFEEPVPDTHDLALTQMVFPLSAEDGEQVTLRTKVEDQGNQDEDSTIRFYIDGIEQIACTHDFSVAAGHTTPVFTCDWEAELGYHVFEIIASPVYGETDLADNKAWSSLVVVPADTVPQVIVDANPSNGSAPLTVQLNCQAYDGNAPYAYSWDFGDSSATSVVQNPLHTYTAAGDYIATCTAADADGDVAAGAVQIVVNEEIIDRYPTAEAMLIQSRAMLLWMWISPAGGPAETLPCPIPGISAMVLSAPCRIPRILMLRSVSIMRCVP